MENINHLIFVFALNNSAIAEFIHRYQVGTDIQYPSTADLHDLQEVLNKKMVDIVFDSMDNFHLFIHLEDNMTLRDQLSSIEKKIEKLQAVNDEPQKEPINEADKLRKWWVEIQLQVMHKFKDMLTKKQEELSEPTRQTSFDLS